MKRKCSIGKWSAREGKMGWQTHGALVRESMEKANTSYEAVEISAEARATCEYIMSTSDANSRPPSASAGLTPPVRVVHPGRSPTQIVAAESTRKARGF